MGESEHGNPGEERSGEGEHDVPGARWQRARPFRPPSRAGYRTLQQRGKRLAGRGTRVPGLPPSGREVAVLSRPPRAAANTPGAGHRPRGTSGAARGLGEAMLVAGPGAARVVVEAPDFPRSRPGGVTPGSYTVAGRSRNPV